MTDTTEHLREARLVLSKMGRVFRSDAAKAQERRRGGLYVWLDDLAEDMLSAERKIEVVLRTHIKEG